MPKSEGGDQSMQGSVTPRTQETGGREFARCRTGSHVKKKVKKTGDPRGQQYNPMATMGEGGAERMRRRKEKGKSSSLFGWGPVWCDALSVAFEFNERGIVRRA